ncbi:MAG: glycosyltransferase family 2 protein [Bacilli bacterium]
MKKPLISVVLPIYNVEAYIEECLDSLINQTIGVENLEVIMVNDCSKDNTAQIIDRYAEKYNNFKAIHLEKNSGAPGKPRNVGIDAATGKYLMFLDPDDYIPLDAYEKLYNVMKEYKSDFVMGKMISFNEQDNFEYEHITFKNYLLQKNYFNVNINDVKFFLQVKTAVYLKLINLDFLRKHKLKFLEGMKNGEDKFFEIQLFTKANKFSYIPEVVYRYRTRNDEKNPSMTQRDIISTVSNDLNVAKMIRPTISKNNFNYFQVNVLRSVLWKVCDPDFNLLPKRDQLIILNLMREVFIDYDEKVVKKYFELEAPFLKLVSLGHFDEALEFNNIIISRRWWYKKGIELAAKYREQQSIRNSFSWRITKPLRSKKLFDMKNKLIKRSTVSGN